MAFSARAVFLSGIDTLLSFAIRILFDDMVDVAPFKRAEVLFFQFLHRMDRKMMVLVYDFRCSVGAAERT